MPTPDDIPETVDFKWIARHILALHGDVRALRDEVDVMAAILRRVDNNQTSYRDELARSLICIATCAGASKTSSAGRQPVERLIANSPVRGCAGILGG